MGNKYPKLSAYLEKETIELMVKKNVGNKADMLFAKAEELCRLIEDKGIDTDGSSEGIGVVLRPVSYIENDKQVFGSVQGQLKYSITNDTLTLNAKVDMTGGVRFSSIEVGVCKDNSSSNVIRGIERILESDIIGDKMKTAAKTISDAGYIRD